MSRRSVHRGVLGVLAVLGSLPACAAQIDSEDESASEAASAGALASITFDDGNVVSFYEMGGGAFVTENVLAEQKPHFSYGEHVPRDVTQVWRDLAPDKPVPSALTALKERMSSGKSTLAERPAPRVDVEPQPTIAGEVGVASAALTAADCPNGCCNNQWLHDTFSECRITSGDDVWRDINVPGAAHNHDDTWEFGGVVCAVSSTRWTVDIGNAHHAFELDPTEGQRFSWIAGDGGLFPFATKNMRSAARVVSPGTTTYCGFANFR